MGKKKNVLFQDFNSWNPRAKAIFLLVFISVIITFVLYFRSIIDNKPQVKPNQTTSIFKTTRGGDFAATSEEIYDRVLKLAETRDAAAVDELKNLGLVIILKPGLEVQIMDRSFGKIKIRLKGTNTEVWTAIEAVN